MKVSGGDCSHGDPCSYDIHALLLLLPVFLHFNLFFVFFLVCKGEICEYSLGAGILPFSILSLTRQRSSHLPPLKNVKFTYPKGGGGFSHLYVLRFIFTYLSERVAKGSCVTRDGPKICKVTRDWTQIIRMTRDRTPQLDAWFSILQVRGVWFTRLTY